MMTHVPAQALGSDYAAMAGAACVALLVAHWHATKARVRAFARALPSPKNRLTASQPCSPAEAGRRT